MTDDECAAVRNGAPMPPCRGWMSVGPYSISIEFGDDAEMATRHHHERCGGRRFEVEMRELPS